VNNSNQHHDQPYAGFQINRRSFLSNLSSLAGAAASAQFLFSVRGAIAQTPSTDKMGKTVIAKTIYGQVRGMDQDGVLLFKGIPYAGSSAGTNRFKAPPKLKPWKGVRDALLYGAQAIQPPDPNWPKDWKPALASEECLFLNVWTPGIADGGRRPVMFYSHGGGFATGNGGADVFPQNLFHDGGSLAKSYDVVVVTHNHRLGLLGYLYLGDLLREEYAASGAAGMLDIAAALQWVKDNIESFGGDPGNVMIWGESGGGAKTATLTALPQAQGLYHKASVESGPALRLTPRDAANETTLQVLSKLGLSEKQAREIVNIPAVRLSEVQQSLSGASPMRFGPVVDGHFIPSHPYDPVAPAISAKIPMIIGTNKDESIFFNMGNPDVFSLDEAGLRSRLQPVLGDKLDLVLEVYRHSRPQASPTDLYIAITTAQWMGRSAILMAERKVALHAAPVYMYVFAYESEAPVGPSIRYPRKAAHAEEIPFKFNHPEGASSRRPERVKAARNMSRAWAAFARTGNPSHDEIPSWPAYTLEQRGTMYLDAECKVINDPYREERLIWNEIPSIRQGP
jgi:para-nitrobenzyl esterase